MAPQLSAKSDEAQAGIATRWDQACEDLRQKGVRQRAAAAKKEQEKASAAAQLAARAPVNELLKQQRDADALPGSADWSADSEKQDDYDALLDDDADLDKLRQARLAQYRKQKDQYLENKAKGHGEYIEIVEDQFLKECLKSKFVLCHFYTDDFERCKIYDKHLRILANKHVETKFMKINAVKTPFFVEKLSVRTLPTLCIFCDGANVDRITGFEGLSGDEFTTRELEERLGLTGCIKMERGFYETDDLDGGDVVTGPKKSTTKRIISRDDDDWDWD